jgi:hypothetical protein
VAAENSTFGTRGRLWRPLFILAMVHVVLAIVPHIILEIVVPRTSLPGAVLISECEPLH